jgi:hypothetical protein
MTTDLEILRADLVAARLPHPRARIALLAAAAAVTLTAAAYAANHYLGQPAPANVKATFVRIGGWMPGSGTIEVSKAEVVALSPHTVLFGAPTRTGRYCLELLGRRGFVYQVFCAGPKDPKRLLLYAGLANHGTTSSLPPVAVTGRMSARGRTLEVRTPDGHVQRVTAGLHGFFSFEPTEQDAARRGRAMLYERDAAGTVTTRVRIPAQIVLDTKGTPTRRVEGVIFDPRAKHIFFEVWAQQPRIAGCVKGCSSVGIAQTGIGHAVAVAADGRFSFTAPPTPGFKLAFLSMIATDARFVPLSGDLIDSTNVPDESFWKHARAEAQRNGV